MNAYQDQNLKQEQQRIWQWRDLLIILLGIIGLLFLGALVFVVVSIAGGVNLENLAEPTISQTLSLTLLETLALVLGVYLFGIRRKGLTWKAVGFQGTTLPWVLISLVGTAIIIPIASLVTLAALYLTGQPIENPQLDFLLPEGLSPINALLMLLLAGIAAPIAEELFFRGVLYTFLRERWGIGLSVFVSSFLFGLIHGNIAVGLTGFLLGILAAIVFEYSKSLWTAIIVHAINNSAKIMLLYLLVLIGVEI